MQRARAPPPTSFPTFDQYESAMRKTILNAGCDPVLADALKDFAAAYRNARGVS